MGAKKKANKPKVQGKQTGTAEVASKPQQKEEIKNETVV